MLMLVTMLMMVVMIPKAHEDTLDVETQGIDVDDNGCTAAASEVAAELEVQTLNDDDDDDDGNDDDDDDDGNDDVDSDAVQACLRENAVVGKDKVYDGVTTKVVVVDVVEDEEDGKVAVDDVVVLFKVVDVANLVYVEV